jgi:hypothetical protein
MRRLVRSGMPGTILAILSWILVALIAFFYFRALLKGHPWLDELPDSTHRALSLTDCS